MKENENPHETLKRLRAGFLLLLLLLLFFIYGNGWIEFGYIIFGLNGPQRVFS